MATAEHQARWRAKARAALLASYGGFCYGCGANGRTRLDLAHLYPTEPHREPDGMIRAGNGDRTLAEARAHPFLFRPLCRPCHRAADGPDWGRSFRH